MIFYFRNVLHNVQNMSSIFVPNSLFRLFLGVTVFLSWIQTLPWTHYLYYLMPVFTTSIAFNINLPSQKMNRHLQQKKLSFSLSLLNNIIEAIGVKAGEWHFKYGKWKENVAKCVVIFGIAG